MTEETKTDERLAAQLQPLVGPVSLTQIFSASGVKWQFGWPPLNGCYLFRLSWWRDDVYDFAEVFDGQLRRLKIKTEWSGPSGFQQHLDRSEVMFVGPLVM